MHGASLRMPAFAATPARGLSLSSTIVGREPTSVGVFVGLVVAAAGVALFALRGDIGDAAGRAPGPPRARCSVFVLLLQPLSVDVYGKGEISVSGVGLADGGLRARARRRDGRRRAGRGRPRSAVPAEALPRRSSTRRPSRSRRRRGVGDLPAAADHVDSGLGSAPAALAAGLALHGRQPRAALDGDEPRRGRAAALRLPRALPLARRRTTSSSGPLALARRSASSGSARSGSPRSSLPPAHDEPLRAAVPEPHPRVGRGGARGERGAPARQRRARGAERRPARRARLLAGPRVAGPRRRDARRLRRSRRSPGCSRPKSRSTPPRAPTGIELEAGGKRVAALRARRGGGFERALGAAPRGAAAASRHRAREHAARRRGLAAATSPRSRRSRAASRRRTATPASTSSASRTSPSRSAAASATAAPISTRSRSARCCTTSARSASPSGSSRRRARSTRRSGRSCAPTRDLRAHPRRERPARRSCSRPRARATSAWTAKGYPDGLAGEEIPLPARIVLVADAYDALTSDRSYRSGRSPAEALAEIRAARRHTVLPAGRRGDGAGVRRGARDVRSRSRRGSLPRRERADATGEGAPPRDALWRLSHLRATPVMKWSASSASSPRSICTQLTVPVKTLLRNWEAAGDQGRHADQLAVVPPPPTAVPAGWRRARRSGRSATHTDVYSHMIVPDEVDPEALKAILLRSSGAPAVVAVMHR